VAAPASPVGLKPEDHGVFEVRRNRWLTVPCELRHIPFHPVNDTNHIGLF